MEEYSVYGSEEEEPDDPRDGETDEDLTDEERGNHEVVIPLFQCETILIGALLLVVSRTKHLEVKCAECSHVP